jgi:type II secretory pathway pseudopilin PulG
MPAVMRRRRRRGRGEAGFTLVSVMGAMVVIALTTVAAFAAVDGDARESGKDVARKQALAAAEAGVNQYLYGLNGDNDYWAKCTGVPTPNAVNDVWNRVPPDPRKWATVPGASTQYTIELLPANGYAKCSPGSNVADSMIDADSRTLRIRVTGRAQSAKGPVTRSVIAALKRDSFLDFLWFTDYETSDPVWYSVRSNGRATGGTQGDLLTWAANNCPEYYRAPWKRGNEAWDGKFLDDNSSYPGNVTCDNIAFITGDALLGPLHTNDELLACGTPTFGRNAQDRIESGNGWRSGGCSGTPNFQGTLIPDSSTIGMPATNASLATVAAAGGYTFSGPTTIKFGLAPGKLTVTNAVLGYSNTQIPYPGNGVIYVKASGSCPLYSALRPSYSSKEPTPPGGFPASYPPMPNVAGCGDALVSGAYDTDLTIATQNDLIVTGDILRQATGDAMLGLIADGFVRIEHDTNNYSLSAPPADPDCDNVASGNRRVDAAILTLLHSVTVDRYYCGNPIGKLTINGMIAQKFRGAVGKNSGGSVVHGFLKDYSYDPRLAFRSPPHFLDPVKSAWHVHRYTEQEPAAK